MPYTYRKNKLRRLRRKFKRKSATKAVDRRQDRSISKLYKMVKHQKEKKYVDQGNTIQMASSWVNMLTRDLTYIAQGTSGNQRDGNKIKILSHHIKVIATVGDTTNLYRFMVIRFDSQATSNVQIGDALQTPIAATPFQLLSFLKRNTDCKYKILYDTGIKRLAGNEQTDAPSGTVSQRIHDIRLKGPFYAAYSGAGAGDVVQGFTYLIGCSDSALTPHVQFQTNVRTIFSG